MIIETIITVFHDTDNLIIRGVPVSSVIVELPDKGLCIVDTGYAGNPELADQLAEIGYAPADFDLVINTHLHVDHIGGNRLFNNARIIISRHEFEYENQFNRILRECNDPLAALRSMGRQVDENAYKLVWDLKRLAEQFPVSDLVGDQSQIEFFEDEPHLPQCISTLQVPGHSIDSRAVILQGHKRRAVVAGDALYHRDLWREISMESINYDDGLFMQNAKYLAQLPHIIIPGHDRAFDNLNHRYLEDDYVSI